MATDPQSLFSQGACYACYGASAFQIMKLALLAQLVQQKDASAKVDPQSLLAQAACFSCYSTSSIADLMELALLLQLAS